MDLELHGKRAFVTGSSSGIGAATAKILAAEGAKVVVHGRSHDKTRKVVDAILAAGGEAGYVIGELDREDVCADAPNKPWQSSAGSTSWSIMPVASPPPAGWIRTPRISTGHGWKRRGTTGCGLTNRM